MGMIRLGWAPDQAVAQLLSTNEYNVYWRTGFNWSPSGGFTYLPGNGGTLAAVAMMAMGTATSPACNFPAAWGAICEGFTMQFP